MTCMQIFISISAVLVAGFIVVTRRMSIWEHSSIPALFNVGMLILCGTALERAWNNDPLYWYGVINVTVAALWLYMTRFSWRNGVPEHYKRAPKV